MSDKRRAELEAKRAKLAELRKARADRQRTETERRAVEVCNPKYLCHVSCGAYVRDSPQGLLQFARISMTW